MILGKISQKFFFLKKAISSSVSKIFPRKNLNEKKEEKIKLNFFFNKKQSNENKYISHMQSSSYCDYNLMSKSNRENQEKR